MCLTQLYNESPTSGALSKGIRDDLFSRSIVHRESSTLVYRTFTIDPRPFGQIARFAFPHDTYIMQSHAIHNGESSRGNNDQFPELKRSIFLRNCRYCSAHHVLTELTWWLM